MKALKSLGHNSWQVSRECPSSQHPQFRFTNRSITISALFTPGQVRAKVTPHPKHWKEMLGTGGPCPKLFLSLNSLQCLNQTSECGLNAMQSL